MQMKPIAAGIASLGRGNDKMLVHMTPGEVAGLQAIAMKHGGSLTINPHTGLPEAGFLSSILPTIAGAAITAMTGIPAWQAGLLVGGLGALSSGSLSKGLMAGLGAFGGAGLGSALSNAGLNAFQQEALATAERQAAERALASVPSIDQLSGMYQLPSAPPTPAVPNFGGSYDLAQSLDIDAALPSQASPAPASSSMVTPEYVEQIRRAAEADAQMTQLSPADAARVKADAATQFKDLSPMDRLSRSWEAAKSGNVDFSRDIIGQAANKKDGTEKTGLGGLGGAATTAGMALAPALAYGATQLAQQPTLRGLPSLAPASLTSGAASKYSFAPGAVNPRFGQPGEPYFLDRGFYAAEGGTVPNPNDMYPQASIDKSAYAVSAQTPRSSEVLGNYSPNVDPFSGEQRMASGGIAGLHEYAAGGRLLDGPGDGMSDSIPAVIKGPKPQRAALADGEFVVPADVVSHLGNGSTKAGAQRLYKMMDKVRMARVGTKKQGKQINADRFVPA